jgi:hypothetical protein
MKLRPKNIGDKIRVLELSSNDAWYDSKDKVSNPVYTQDLIVKKLISNLFDCDLAVLTDTKGLNCEYHIINDLKFKIVK